MKRLAALVSVVFWLESWVSRNRNRQLDEWWWSFGTPSAVPWGMFSKRW